MKFLIIHLSDMHIKEHSSIESTIIEKVQNVIINDSVEIDDIIFIITGDIANTGKSLEYYTAIDVINSVTSKINGKNKYIAICQGNHDKDLSTNESVHDDIVDKVLGTKEIIQEKFNFLNDFFKNYNEFELLIESDNKHECKKENFISTHSINIEGIKIEIDAINTALCSKKSCKHASLYMPIESIPKKKQDCISICIMHNTENWINHENRKEYRERLTATYDFIFSGHEHTAYNYRIESCNGNEAIMVEGGALQPHSADEVPEFNTITINTQQNTAIIKRYTYNYAKGFFHETRCNKFPFGGSALNIHVGTTSVSINKEAISEIQDSGAPYLHPIISNLTLDDLFIYPDVQKFEYSTSKGQFKPLTQSMGDINCVSGRYIFLGAEKSGKSHCSRRIFLNSTKSGNIPVLIKLTDKSNIHGIEDFEKEIVKAAKNTYTEIDIDDFKQTDNNRKNIIIDDFHTFRTNNSKKYKLLGELVKLYPNICIFSDDSTQFDTLLYSNATGGSNLHDAFQIHTIMQFNNQKRDELIRKWHKNDLPYDENPVSIERSIENSRTILNTIVRNGFVPSYPFFLYTALSSFTTQHTDTKIEESTYGHFFTILLNIAVAKISSRAGQNDLYFNYLTEFSFKLFENNRSHMTLSEFNDFHNWYIEEFSLSKPYSDMLEKLIIAKLLQTRDDIIFFRYKYFYFYFIAKKLTASLHNQKTKNIIAAFCDSLHQETSSNVLVFLIHLSKDESIIDSLITKAKQLLSSYKEADLKNGINFIDELIYELPELVFDSEENHTEEKKKMLAMADSVEKLPDSTAYSGDSVKPLKEEDTPKVSSEFSPLIITNAFKTIEIIGQIMRNYHGSLNTTLKDSLCQEAYSLTLRSISAFFETLATDRDRIIEDLAKALENISPEQKEKRIKVARNFLFGIASMLAYAFITKCASDLGSDDLSVTFKRILAKYESAENFAVSLIDIAIKFDHQKQSPTEDVKRLSQKTANSNVCFTILQWLTYRHMRIFPLPVETRQKLCQSTNISLKATTLLSHKTSLQ